MNRLIQILRLDSVFTEALETIELYEKEELFITGGFLRNSVWNFLHSFNNRANIFDCDVVFYNQFSVHKYYEKHIESCLNNRTPDIKWSVKNQARMHSRNGHSQYKSLSDAISKFPETSSAVAVGKNYSLITPYGISDLLDLKLQPTPYCEKFDIATYHRRIHEKMWNTKWPLLN